MRSLWDFLLNVKLTRKCNDIEGIFQYSYTRKYDTQLEKIKVCLNMQCEEGAYGYENMALSKLEIS